MKFLSTRIEAFRNDRLIQMTVVLSFVFLALHVIGYFDSDGKMEVVIRAMALLIYPLFAFIGNRKGMRFWVVIYAYILFWFYGTLNYTPFIILAILSYRFDLQKSIAVFIIYAILVSVRSTINDIAPFRIVFHGLKCGVFYYGIKVFLKYEKKEKLRLMPDEILILEELSKGKQLNELTLFSNNTVCRKLKAARERNGLKSNEDLVLKYLNSKNKND